ncbi:hypothetical protein B0J11DRAFT_431772 [Dendryphion nanum]|uniref:Calpain catalytic domain-containing protein n=1 Tax=Dendryphion nanum TaxID=256645 RepID=A0A9P9IRJ0_9PLEO|nr:hypothetical protein B0J11DRAFT_431772 [Dendryphion nanum]
MASVTGTEDDSKAPQEILEEFWENLVTKNPGKVTNIFPPTLYSNLLPPRHKPGTVKGKNAAESYQLAADECRARVKRIVRECHRTNEKFTDPEFDIEEDLGEGNCLEGLLKWYNESGASSSFVSPYRLAEAIKTLADTNAFDPAVSINIQNAAQALNDDDTNSSGGGPGTVHRIDWIFEDPHFTVDGFSSSDVQQGANGDCWFIAAVATICSNPSLMHKICVERDEECGVYGFVFYRDGDWISTVVDSNLYLNYKDFDAYGDDYDPSGKKERKYKKNNQTGSDALYFASCADQNETWLPLLEKAYAKVHGDYDSIAGGWSGEAVEDLTGGVTTKVLTNRILSKQRLWKELLDVNKTFMFSVSSPGSYGDDSTSRNGLALNHAYSVIKAVEEEDENGKKHQLVLIRNPWGRRSWNGVGEWSGAWSDGSKEWTPYWMNKLNYRFGDDGLFWMSYEDMQKRFDVLDRTRLFDKNWTVVQLWTSVSVAWVTGYLTTKFVVDIKKAGPTVFVLSQLDDRYFKGLEGKYGFDLHFLLQEKGSKPGDHIVRARGAWFGNRSISAEVDLEPGQYEVVPKIVAYKNDGTPDVHEVVTKVANKNPQKLRQIGMNYDIANAKGIIEISEEEKKKKADKKKEAEEKKRKEKEDAEKEKAEFEAWKKEKKEREEKEKAEKDNKASKESKKDETTEATSSEEKKEDPSSTAVEEKKETTTASSNEKKTDLSETSKETVKESNDAAKEKPTVTTKSQAVSVEKQDSPVVDPSPADKEVNSAVATSSDVSSSAQDTPPSSGDETGHSPPGAGPTGGDVPTATTSKVEDKKQKPWNAVCVMGLRVYSQDVEVSIKLVKPTDPEETAVLDADGATPAGATM